MRPFHRATRTSIEAGGCVSNAGTISAAKTLTLSTAQDIDNSGGTLNAGRLVVDAGSLRNAITTANSQPGTQTITFNIPGVNAEVKFTPDVLAYIYLGKVTSWNDARITKVNPGVNFPNQTITVDENPAGVDDQPAITLCGPKVDVLSGVELG